MLAVQCVGKEGHATLWSRWRNLIGVLICRWAVARAKSGYFRLAPWRRPCHDYNQR
jgi:hypothetical protein